MVQSTVDENVDQVRLTNGRRCAYTGGMRKYNLYLSEPQIEALAKISDDKGLSVSEVIRRALDAFIEAEEKKALKKAERRRT